MSEQTAVAAQIRIVEELMATVEEQLDNPALARDERLQLERQKGQLWERYKYLTSEGSNEGGAQHCAWPLDFQSFCCCCKIWWRDERR